MLSKEEIEKAKKKLELMEYKYTLTNNDDKAIEILLQYIKELEESNKDLDHENNRLEKIEFERDKANKIIDLMAEEINDTDPGYNDYCNSTKKCSEEECKNCIKQYFEKKVNENNEHRRNKN